MFARFYLLQLLILGFFSGIGYAEPPEDLTHEQVLEQLQRRPGQTVFINRASYGGVRALGASARGGGALETVAAASAESAVERDISEADVQIVDEKTGILYLLHATRGVIAIDPKREKRLGRSAASPNRPRMAYFEPKNGRLIVIEQDYTGVHGDAESEEKETSTFVISYNVSNPADIQIESKIEVKGTVSTSRMLGDKKNGYVLYLASGRREKTYTYEGQKTETYGELVSISLGKTLTEIQKHRMGTPGLQEDGMHVVKGTLPDGSFKYYMMAMVSRQPEHGNRWWWWDRLSDIELVDISSPKGDIQHVLTVSAKGHIAKPSQLNVDGGVLYAVSSYDANGTNSASQRRNRNAFESWVLPTGKNDTVLIPEDLAHRQAKLKLELTKIENPEDPTADYDRLMASPEIGLKGAFARIGDRLTKVTPDAFVSTGDSRGQSASLQSVRYLKTEQGMRAYAFWVPTNEVDPCDRVDFVDGTATFVDRLEFPGWIQHARLLQSNGRTFVLGIGYVVPATAEDNRRVPMAKLIEVLDEADDEDGGSFKTLATYTFKGKNYSLDDARDVEYDLQYDHKSQEGVFMFPVASYTTTYEQGGQLIAFSLAKALAGKKKEVFTQGQMVKGDAGWLQRAFRDGVTDSLIAFTTQELAVYPGAKDSAGFAKMTLEAVRKLELARNIQAYVRAGLDTGLAVQVVSRAEVTQLRLVRDSEPDAELPEVLQTVEVPGHYLAQFGLVDGRLVIFTNETIRENKGYRSLTTGKIFAVENNALVEKAGAQVDMTRDRYVQTSISGVVPLAEDRFLLSTNGSLVEGRFSASTLELAVSPIGASPESDPHSYRTVLRLGGKLYIAYQTPIEVPSEMGSKGDFKRNFLAAVSCPTFGSCETGKPINVPGDAQAIIQGTDGKPYLVQYESLVVDLAPQTKENRHQNAVEMPAYLSLEVGDTVATLRNVMQTSDASPYGSHQIGTHGPLATLHRADYGSGMIGFGGWGGMMPGRRHMQSAASQLELLYVVEGGQLRIARKNIQGLTLAGYVNLADLFLDPTDPTQVIGLISQGSAMQVIRGKYDPADITSRPQVVEVSLTDPLNRRMAPGPVANVPTYVYFSPGQTDALAYQPESNAITLALGDAGVCRLYLAEAGSIKAKPVKKPKAPKK